MNEAKHTEPTIFHWLGSWRRSTYMAIGSTLPWIGQSKIQLQYTLIND